MAFGLETGPENVVKIKVIGVGGGGNNVVNRMVRSGALDFGKDKQEPSEASSAPAGGIAPLDFDREKAEEAKKEEEPDPFDDIFKIFNREK